ncbi:MAG TPA: lysozyme inhibitor LprI family protein [Stellaceae bacterium]|nr:lysozyme inhibitor LprI family protein [Stellaceae bacterium]
MLGNRSAIWGLLVLVLCAREAAAQSADWKKCVDGTTTNVEWSRCGQEEIDRQEARLNAAWKQAFACFSGAEEMAKAKQDFLAEQRLWVKWKDASCNFYAEGEAFGREGQVVSYPACRAAVILQRTQFLEEFGKSCG